MLTDDHPEPPPAAPRPLAPHSRGCLHCDYPLADRPIGTICPECGHTDRRACAVCGTDLAERSENDRCPSCGTPIRDALAETLLIRLPTPVLRRVERAALVLSLTPLIAVPAALLSSLFGLTILPLTIVALAGAALPIAVLGAAVIPRGLVLPRQLVLYAWGARSASAAVFAFAIGVALALYMGADATIITVLLAAAFGALFVSSGLHAGSLTRKRTPVAAPARGDRFGVFWPWALAAAGLAAMFALMGFMGGTLCIGNLAAALVVIGVPVFAWSQWLTLAFAARAIRQSREAALPPPPPTRSTPDTAAPDPS